MADGARHVEFFGPDMARGPVLSGAPEVAAVQIATALAQLRAPLTRDDEELEGHADFIRALADRLFPDYASAVNIEVGAFENYTINTQIRVESGTPSLLHCWLANDWGGGLASYTPDAVQWNSGTIIQTVVSKKYYIILTPPGGVVDVDVTHVYQREYRWAIARHGLVNYSYRLEFIG